MTDPELYPYFTRTRESSALRNPAILSVLKYYKWNKIAILTESVEFISPTVVKMKSLLSENNVTLHSMLTIEDKANRAMRQLKDSTARIFLVYTRHALLIDILCEAYKNKMYGPRFQWLFWSNGTTSINTKLYTDEVTCTIEQLLVTATSMISVVNVPDQNDYKNTVNTDMGYTFAELSKVYTTWLKQLPPSYLADYPLDLLNSTLRTYDVDTLWTVARALHNTDLKLKATGNTSLLDFEYETGSGIAKVLYHEITNLKFYGTTGFISFDKMGDRINNVYITQLTSDMQEKIVGAFNQSIFQLHWSLDNPVTFQGGKPAKDSDTIVYKKLALRPALYWSVLGISVLFLTICGVCLAFNVYYRDVRIIKLSSPNVNTIISIGCALTIIFVILLGKDNPEEIGAKQLCGARIWILCSGFTFAYAGMFAKTWRVHVIFTNKKAMKKAVKDVHLYLFVAIAWALDIVIMLSWQISDPLEVSLVNVDTEYHGDIILKSRAYVCTSSKESYWSGVLYGYKALFLIFGIFFAWETRKVRIEALNDSKEIGICVYNVMIMSVVSVPIYQMLTLRQMDASFAVLSAAVMVCTITTLGLVFGSKMQTILFGGNEVDAAILPFASTLQTQHQSRRARMEGEFTSDTASTFKAETTSVEVK